MATQEFSLELRLCLFQVLAAELHLVQLQMERPVAVGGQIKTEARQVLQQLQVAEELTLLVVPAQLVIRAVQQQDLYLVMVLICKVEHLVTKLMLKAVVVAAAVSTAAAAVRIKQQVVDQKMAAVVVARVTLIQHGGL